MIVLNLEKQKITNLNRISNWFMLSLLLQFNFRLGGQVELATTGDLVAKLAQYAFLSPSPCLGSRAAELIREQAMGNGLWAFEQAFFDRHQFEIGEIFRTAIHFRMVRMHPEIVEDLVAVVGVEIGPTQTDYGPFSQAVLAA